MMAKYQWETLELIQLVAIYKKEATALKQSLLNGAAWNELRDKRDLVTELTAAIHKKNIEKGLPAEKGLIVIDSPFKQTEEKRI
jgi:hypothetical protein